jgi:hypothetical protein
MLSPWFGWVSVAFDSIRKKYRYTFELANVIGLMLRWFHPTEMPQSTKRGISN